jgi:protein involved in temperature-dependent protein secretion
VDTAHARQLEPVAGRARVLLADALCARAASENSANVHLRDALKLAHEAAQRSRAMGLTLHEALARRVLAQGLAQTGNWSHALREFEAAAAIQEEQSATVELVRTLVATCQAEYVYAKSPRREHIRAQLVRAKQMAARIGIESEGKEVIRLLAALED